MAKKRREEKRRDHAISRVVAVERIALLWSTNSLKKTTRLLMGIFPSIEIKTKMEIHK